MIETINNYNQPSHDLRCGLSSSSTEGSSTCNSNLSDDFHIIRYTRTSKHKAWYRLYTKYYMNFIKIPSIFHVIRELIIERKSSTERNPAYIIFHNENIVEYSLDYNLALFRMHELAESEYFNYANPHNGLLDVSNTVTLYQLYDDPCTLQIVICNKFFVFNYNRIHSTFRIQKVPEIKLIYDST